ncbi:response regulator [Flavobacterium sp. GA093]|uniref:Response regulator n=1 Tax=Flavobacterium hydrocarbonoxydans TaxID=2683249 RepID=A0A6I4NP31_9FLAO|nr:response regulator [Flavobacterium hydrocarbonoxydans]MWB94335.1 response regulator [Flavobacterium hydrocarbonoxydans]
MNNAGNIIVIENNKRDRQLFTELFSELNFSNEIVYFSSGKEAYNSIISSNKKPFLIFSDIVLLQMEDHKLIDRTYKNVSKELNCPYLFFTTAVEQSFVIDAYSNPTKSYFIKPFEYEKFKEVIKSIIDYWLKEEKMPQHIEKLAKEIPVKTKLKEIKQSGKLQK